MNTEEFYKLPKSLALADGYISKATGEAIKLSASGKIIYAYMLTKNGFFTDKMKGQHFESQATIAKACGLEYKAAGTILRAFIEHGVMDGKKLRPEKGGQWRWHYSKVFTDIVLWEGSIDNFNIVEEKKPVKVQDTPIQQNPQAFVEPAWDDPELPF